MTSDPRSRPRTDSAGFRIELGGGDADPGPPWILGHRGAPVDAPENTLASLGRALDLGLDGVEYDLQRCATGEAVLLHDETLDRTTDGRGPVDERTLPELAGLDAGGWFHRDFVGEPLPLLEEALAIAGPDPSVAPVHMIELKDPGLVSVVARALSGLPRPLPVRLASFHRSVCLEARDIGLPTMLLAVGADEGDRRFVRDERLTAYGVAADGWRTPAGADEWPCERWAWSVDDPDDLVDACRRPLFGFNTNEPLRALAVRRLVRLAPDDDGPYPLRTPALEVVPGALKSARGEWCGRWDAAASVRNPFAWPVAVEVDIELRGGAYEVHGLPGTLELAPGAEESVPFSLVGGSWAPGADPRLFATFTWSDAGGEAQELELDAPLPRVRTLSLGEGPRRLELLHEGPGDPDATMVVRRRGGWLVCVIEGDGRLEDVRAIVHLGGETRIGSRGVRIPIHPDLFERGTAAGPALRSVPFSCGFEGLEQGPFGARRRVRRWSGGVPGDLTSGVPGRLLLRGRG